MEQKAALDPGRTVSIMGCAVHETGVAESVLEMAQECADGRTVKVIRLRVGRRTGVQGDVLRFCFEVATHGTVLEGVPLDIEMLGASRELTVTAVEMA